MIRTPEKDRNFGRVYGGAPLRPKCAATDYSGVTFIKFNRPEHLPDGPRTLSERIDWFDDLWDSFNDVHRTRFAVNYKRMKAICEFDGAGSQGQMFHMMGVGLGRKI